MPFYNIAQWHEKWRILQLPASTVVYFLIFAPFDTPSLQWAYRLWWGVSKRENVTRFSSSFSWFEPSMPLLFWFLPNIRSQSLKLLTLRCVWHRLESNFQVSWIPTFHPWWMYSPIKGFYLIDPFRATRDLHSFRFWLRGVHFDTAVSCAPPSFVNNSNISAKSKPFWKIM